jgi:DNA-binding transcriptional regulator YdaS (Cro superfamily)
MLTGLEKAIKLKGGMTNLARALGVSPQLVCNWRNYGINVPLPFAFLIQTKTNKKVTWQEVVPHLAYLEKECPDVFNSDNDAAIQTIQVLLAQINHTCHIQPPVQAIRFLANDIQSHGLQRPICIDTDNHLIFGEKRLHAYEMLGNKTILAWRLSFLDVVSNKLKKALPHLFIFDEYVAIGSAIEEALGDRQGERTELALRQNFVEVKGRTDEFIAKLLGFGNRQTYRQAKRVCQLGGRKLIEAINLGQFRISTAALLTQFSIEYQQHILSWPREEIKAFVRQLRQGNLPDFSNVNLSLSEENNS